MDESILNSVKRIIGIPTDYGAFDPELIMHINAALMVVFQLGVGSSNFSISGTEETWSDFLGNAENLGIVKPYVAMKTRKAFDPPSGAVATALNETLAEYEWRLNVALDNPTTGNLLNP